MIRKLHSEPLILGIPRDLGIDLGAAAFAPPVPTGCFLRDRFFFVVPFLDLALLPLFFVAMIFSLIMVRKQPN
jgi:hypothetical protein